MGREFESLRGHIGGVSSAGLEHYLDRVGVTGSNPVHPTFPLHSINTEYFRQRAIGVLMKG